VITSPSSRHPGHCGHWAMDPGLGQGLDKRNTEVPKPNSSAKGPHGLKQDIKPLPSTRRGRTGIPNVRTPDFGLFPSRARHAAGASEGTG